MINFLQRYSRSFGRIETIPSEATTAHYRIDDNTAAAAATTATVTTAITTVTWMNDTGITVCSAANVASIGNQNNALSNMLKRSSDLLIDGVVGGYEKRVKLEANHQEDQKLVFFSFLPF